MALTRDPIVCVLPVRNGGERLHDWLAAAPAWCDAVVALDDGSTDDTRAQLAASPLVRETLTNPPRPTAAGWHDGQNRNRLLAAAATLDPGWIIQVDVDEWIPDDDAREMRAFLASDALPGIAYGFVHWRAWGDGFDPDVRWVYRLFAWRLGLEFPDEALHFNPVPTAIPTRAWVRTTLRVCHVGAVDDAALEVRRRKYTEADPEGRYGANFGGLDAVPGRTVSLPRRRPDQPVLLASDDLDDSAFAAEEPRDRALLAVLVPVRNGEEDLPGWLYSVRRIADAVVALDDGSTDRTRELLEGDPLVRVLVTRPVRPDYAGWDDAGNRQALLDATATVAPRWVLFLDVDERLHPSDGDALRAFIDGGGARPGWAYGFRVHRMIDTVDAYDKADLVVHRLFAWEPDLRLPEQRLHLVPVPARIPAERQVETTLRIQHLAGLTAARRQARIAKYRQADPHLEHQADYGDLLAEPDTLRPFVPRPPDQPVIEEVKDRERARLVGDDVDPDGFDGELDAPVLSAIVIARDDRNRIERVVASVVDQIVPQSVEVIVVVSGSPETAAIVRERFPSVTVVELAQPVWPGVARNAGLALARGDYVSFPGSHVELLPGSLAARVRAHERGYPMVTGTTLNGTNTPAGWASYFLDHSAVLPGRPSEELRVAPAHCSYDREILLRVGGFPEDRRAGEDTVVNNELFRRGYRAYRAADVPLVHASPCRDLPKLLRHHFQRGRGFGQILVEDVRPGARLLTKHGLRSHLLRYMRRRLRVVDDQVARWADPPLRAQFRAVRPLVVAGTAAAWLGTWAEILRPAPGRLRRLFGVPAFHLVLGGLDARQGFPTGRTDALAVVRVEPLRAHVRVLVLPRHLLVSRPGGDPCRLNEVYYHGARQVGGDPFGGVASLREVVGSVLRVRIHGVAVVDFGGFAAVVDALGGVTVEVPHAIDDEHDLDESEHFAAHFRAGRHRLDGASAVVYARTRMADGEGWRQQRHIDLLRGMVGSATSALRSPRRALEVVRAARRAVNSDIGPWRGVLVAQAVLRARHRIEQVLLGPPAVRPERVDGHWVHRADPAAFAAVVADHWVVRSP